MANKKDLKEIIGKYIVENYSKNKVEEQKEDMDVITTAYNAIQNASDERMFQALRSITSIKDVAQLYKMLLSFINQNTPAADLSTDQAIQFLSGDDIPVKRDEEEIEQDIEIDSEEETVDEMSTTAGAPAPATKYAFKRKKK